MNPTELTYPVFEANQVLTNVHLNDMFEYLDEQTRLTRSNLIGIGIACGLEVTFETPGTVHLSKGCGVTSQGYLIVEPTDLDLAFVRSYKLPIDCGYPPFFEPGTNPADQFYLWELFPDDDEPGAQPLAESGLALKDKAVLLFLELRKDGLRNCSPNNCDDRGAEVTATLRRLMIDVTDLDVVIKSTNAAAATHLGADLTERLALPDLRMPRVDVPNSGPAASEEVLFVFQAAFRQSNLVSATAAALTKLYESFEPLVVDEFPFNPFPTLVNRFSFLDTTPATTTQIRFMQYYWDLFDDLLAAYDELRWKGVDLMCACCPPESLFPRHLMAGVLDPVTHDTADYRHGFLPSPAVGDCEDRTREVRGLFSRLVVMLQSFTETPSLPTPARAGPDVQIRITPSRWGALPLSAKAIPYYYEQGIPPLFRLWDPVKTARKRANLNLGYRADGYSPPAPAFVTDPLRFELEPHNFLRIEGHIGKNVHGVLQTLLSLKKSHRLPFEVIALRTGTFDENLEIDLSKFECRFEDLDTLYETLRVELTCFLAKEVQYFYDLPRGPAADDDEPLVPTLELLRNWAPEYRAQPGTIGWGLEATLTWEPGQPWSGLFGGMPGPIGLEVAAVAAAPDVPIIDARAGAAIADPDVASSILTLTGAMSDLAGRISQDIRRLDFATFANRYQRLVEAAKRLEAIRQATDFDQPGLALRLDEIVFRCRLDPFEALANEYKRRLRDVKQAQFLSHFMERHPGLQHKAGVPFGGTFILVYHELPDPAPEPPVSAPGFATGFGDVDIGLPTLSRRSPTAVFEFDETEMKEVGQGLKRLQYKTHLAEDPDIQFLYQAFTGKILVPQSALSRIAEDTYLQAVAELSAGTVIADFFLPYQCCSDCSPIQFVLPPVSLRVDAQMSCTNADGFAEVTLTTEGATGSVSVQVDGGPFEESTGILLLGVGDHTIVVRDDTGAQSPPVEITIPPQLAIGDPDTNVDEAAGTFHVVFDVVGGTPPYVADPGTIVGTAYQSPLLALDEVLTVTIQDAAGCAVEGSFESGVEPCRLPCDGVAILRGHRFWVPEARPDFPLNDYRAEVRTFVFADPNGNQFDLTAEVNEIVNTHPNPIRTGDFPNVVQRWLDSTNGLIANAVGSDQWLRLEYEVASEGATTGTLWVDRIECIEFGFELTVGFVQGQRERQFELTYDSRGTVFVEPNTDAQVHIPPFGGSTSNKCRPDEPPVPLCEGVDMELEIRREGAFPDVVVLTAVASGPEGPVAYLWEMQDGIPSVAGGEQVALTFEPPEPTDKLIRLTAFTERGCTAVLQKTINILPLRVDAQMSCTNADGFAEVTLTTEGATGSVSVQVDGGPFEESTGILLLGVGDHTIVVRDDTGAQSPPVEITIPPQLAIGDPDTNVDEAAGTFHVVFDVVGGTPPYVADPGTIVGTAYQSPLLALDEVLTVTIQDAAGCAVEGSFESGVEPCRLPCDGVAILRGHRFWVPEARPDFPLNDYRAEVRTFVFADPNGNQFDLTAEVNEIVNTHPNPIRTGDFPNVVQRWLDSTNGLIANAVGSDQWLRLEYEVASEGATTGTLWVDRIECIEFGFELTVGFVQGQRERQFELTYDSRGTVFVEPNTDAQVHIPPFGGSTSNKCRPDEPPVPLCEGVDMELEIRREGAFPDVVVLTAVASGPEGPVAYLWEMQDGIPSVAGGEQVALTFEPPEPTDKLIRLTAFTERGCTAVLQKTINIFEPDD